MVELLLFLILAFSSRVVGKGLTFEESLHVLDQAAKAVAIKDDSLHAEDLEEFLEGVQFTPHAYTVRITEPPMPTPVEGFKNAWKIKKDPFLTPIPIADKPEFLKEIQVVHHVQQPAPANKLLIASATIFILLLIFGSAVIMGHCCYILSLSHSRSDFNFSASSLEGMASGEYASEIHAKQRVAFFETVIESMDEIPTLTDESARTLETTRSESETPAAAVDTPTRPSTSRDTPTRPVAAVNSPATLDIPARPPAALGTPPRPPLGTPAQPPTALDSPIRPAPVAPPPPKP